MTENGESKTVGLYSDEALDMLGRLWMKEYVHHKLTHDIKWMGIPIIQFPEDIIMMQELIWKIKPDIIIESGLAHGGSAIFYASLLELIGNGMVVGIDIEIREHNKTAIQKHQLSHRIRMIEGSSVSGEVVESVRKITKGQGKVLVILDSNHSREHVAKELELYKEFVTLGSYMVAMDGAQAFCWDIPNGKEEWKHDNPLEAIEDFIKKNPDFKIDHSYNRLKMTSNPNGFLLRVK